MRGHSCQWAIKGGSSAFLVNPTLPSLRIISQANDSSHAAYVDRIQDSFRRKIFHARHFRASLHQKCGTAPCNRPVTFVDVRLTVVVRNHWHDQAVIVSTMAGTFFGRL
jgi:hypothetical protein